MELAELLLELLLPDHVLLLTNHVLLLLLPNHVLLLLLPNHVLLLLPNHVLLLLAWDRGDGRLYGWLELGDQLGHLASPGLLAVLPSESSREVLECSVNLIIK